LLQLGGLGACPPPQEIKKMLKYCDLFHIKCFYYACRYVLNYGISLMIRYVCILSVAILGLAYAIYMKRISGVWGATPKSCEIFAI